MGAGPVEQGSKSIYGNIWALFEGPNINVAEREGLIRSIHSLTLRAHFVRPNRLRRFVEPYFYFEGSNTTFLH